MEQSERMLLASVARQFYLQDASKKEVAEAHGVSRFKVARMLQQAREEGIVRIEIDDAGLEFSDLASTLSEHLGLEDCVVVASDPVEAENRRGLARAAASYILARTRPDDVLGFSWGRTLLTLGEYMSGLPPVTLVQLTGTVGNDFSQSPAEIIRRIAERASVTSLGVFAPLFTATADTARAMVTDPSNAATLQEYENLDLAVLSIGSWNPPITQLEEYFSATDRTALNNAGARAEIAGIFVRDDGNIAETAVDARRISITAEQLRNTRRVVGVAGTLEKTPAIAAAARSGLISSLVTDDKAAHALLRLPASPPKENGAGPAHDS